MVRVNNRETFHFLIYTSVLFDFKMNTCYSPSTSKTVSGGVIAQSGKKEQPVLQTSITYLI